MEDKISLFDLLSKAEKDGSDLNAVYSNALVQKSIMDRKPLAVQLELWPVCNFKCKFCYIRTTNEELEKSGEKVLRFEDWKYYIDEIVKLKVSSVTFTGGECTLHPDFKGIYKYAYSKGLETGLITNGSLIDDEIIEMFEEFPPSKIYITLYGMSADTYENLCSNGAAFEKVINNIKRLISKKFNVILNYTTSKDNFADLEAALKFARENKIEIIPTDALISSNKCTKDVLNEELVDYKAYKIIEHKHLSILRNIPFEDFEKDYFSTFSEPITSETKTGLHCNAGRCMFSINWKGKMKPCANFDLYQQDPNDIGMEKCWENLVAWADSIPILEECEYCIFQEKCRKCAAMHYNDTGEFGKVSKRFCFKVLYPEEAEKMLKTYEDLKKNQASKQVGN